MSVRFGFEIRIGVRFMDRFKGNSDRFAHNFLLFFFLIWKQTTHNHSKFLNKNKQKKYPIIQYIVNPVITQ